MSTTIRAGQLRHRITVQERSQLQDEFGGQVTTWTNVAVLYAAVEPARAAEKMAAQALQVEISHTITVRYQPWMTGPKQIAGLRAVWGNRIFDFHGAIDVEERHRLVQIPATEGLTNG